MVLSPYNISDLDLHAQCSYEARTLTRAGYRVSIIVLNRKGFALRRMKRNGIPVYFLHLPIERLRSRLFFLFALPLYWFFIFLNLVQLDPDIIYNYNLDTLFPVVLYSKLSRKKVITHIAEWLWSYENPLLSFLLPRIEIYLLNQVDRLTVYQSRKEYYESSVKTPISIVHNSPDPSFFYPGNRISRRNRFVLLCPSYGKVGSEYLTNVLEATKELQSVETWVTRRSVDTEFIARTREYRNLILLKHVPHAELRRYYSEADCVLALYDSTNLNVKTAMPTRVLEAMACGVPVLVSKGMYISNIVERFEVGICVGENDIAGIREAIVKMMDRDLWRYFRRNAISISRKRYNWLVDSDHFLEVFRSVS